MLYLTECHVGAEAQTRALFGDTGCTGDCWATHPRDGHTSDIALFVTLCRVSIDTL